jgi:hypothetical protein
MLHSGIMPGINSAAGKSWDSTQRCVSAKQKTGAEMNPRRQ